MSIKIALAGNPNCGKTTLFNVLTGSNQFVGNWPGVTVEKKEGKAKLNPEVTVTDLPGIYSLSPYTMEEVVARNYLIGERPDAIINLIDGTNLERNLYLTTQLVELGIPVIVAVNMMDLVKKNGDKIDVKELSKRLGCRVVEVSALKGEGIKELVDQAVKASKEDKTVPQHTFSGPVEHAIAHIEEAIVHDLPEEQQRWYAIKVFERDSNVLKKLKVKAETLAHVEQDIAKAEKEMDDDAESIVTNERYIYIAELIKACYKKKNKGQLTVSDKIDKIVTNRWLGLPIFAAVMFVVYYVAMVTVGAAATDWANDGLFGDGFHLFGIGSKEYNEAAEEFGEAAVVLDAFEYADPSEVPENTSVEYTLVDEETLDEEVVTFTKGDLVEATQTVDKYEGEEPDPANYGVWVPGVPVVVGNFLEKIGCNEVLSSLILDGIVAGVGAVLGFVPQMLVLFFMLAILESCGYMARIAFVMDRIFRKFGLSGKSFIPILVGTGCGIPGIMASRTIENDRDRRITIMTTTFIPCGAKIPFIAMVAGAIFNHSPFVSVSAYFIGMAAIIVSGIILKKTKLFAGDPAPFVMELPAYHWPKLSNVLRSTWERGWSFIKKAGTVILLSTIVIWFLTYFGFTAEGFRMLGEDEIDKSLLAFLGNLIAWIFSPLGWGNWQSAVASITGLVAKENIVGTMGILFSFDGGSAFHNLALAFTHASGFSFLLFNLLCAPCFAAIGAIKREMNNRKWTWIAIGYQTVFAYLVALIAYQFGSMFSGYGNVFGFIVAAVALAFGLYLLFRKNPNK
ncbi:MAG: ferrous iron transporter B [Sphaerochaetaceae bacterium]|nr:ferrous iron transporter B [Sphaerochaetaceae bacterium]